MSQEVLMSPAERNTFNITLSEMAAEEFRIVAEAGGLPVSTLLRMVLESHHQSPSFGNMVRRARKRLGQETGEPDSYKDSSNPDV